MYSARVNEPVGAPGDSHAKVQLLRSLEVFRSLTAEELDAVARHSRWLSMPEGSALFAGDQDGGRLYAIHEGEVLISKRGDEGREISLATFLAGESFGELNLFDHQPGDTSARCEQDSLLLAFPAGEEPGAADRFFAGHPGIGAKVLHSLLAVVARRIRSTNSLIAEKSPWVQELRRQVSLDKLTGLFNASFLEEDLVRMVDEGHRRVCLLMLKPDNFKTVNDTYGHQAGDRVLQLMAAELRARLGGGSGGRGEGGPQGPGGADRAEGPDGSPATDKGTGIRYRGDVLAAVLPGAGLQQARRAADVIRKAMSAIDLREVTGGQPLRITVSLGVADSADSSAGSAAALVERAYENLFTARNRGGDRVCAARGETRRRRGE